MRHTNDVYILYDIILECWENIFFRIRIVRNTNRVELHAVRAILSVSFIYAFVNMSFIN